MCNELQTCRGGGVGGGHCIVMMHKQHVFCKSTETGLFWALECFRINVFRPVRVNSPTGLKLMCFTLVLKNKLLDFTKSCAQQ